MALKPAPKSALRILPYRKPTEGRDYWLLDDALPNALQVRERCLAKTDWIEGYPPVPEWKLTALVELIDAGINGGQA